MKMFIGWPDTFKVAFASREELTGMTSHGALFCPCPLAIDVGN
jgi:hypothetical protein